MKYRNYFPCGTKSKTYNSLAEAIDKAMDIGFGVVEVRPYNSLKSVSIPFGWKHNKSTYVTVTHGGTTKIEMIDKKTGTVYL